MGTAGVVIAGITEFLPFINNLVVGFEGLFSKSKSGTQKKQILMQTLTSTLTAVGLVAPGTNTIAPALEAAASQLVDDIVKWKNLTGEFSSTTTPAVVGPNAVK